MKRKLAGAAILAALLVACSSHPAGTPARTAVPIQVGQPHRIQAPATVPVSGSVVSPENPSSVAFLVPGKVVKVGPREGDYVKRGQVLAVIDPTDYSLGVNAAVAQAAATRAILQKVESPVRPEMLEQARVAFERAQSEYQRMKQVYDAKSLPPQRFREIQSGVRSVAPAV
ncbi:MAG: biotin/lipoyl-binding protein [Ignavibacteriota bacterium]